MTIHSIGAASGAIVSALLAAGRSIAQPTTGAPTTTPGDQSRGVGARNVPELSATALESIAGDWQRKLADVAPEVQFSVDQSSGRSLIRVVDGTTNQLIRQIPSEEVLAIDQAIDAFQKRVMPDQEA